MDMMNPPQAGTDAALADEPLRGRRVLIIVENLPVPFDRRVWQEARTLRAAGASGGVLAEAFRWVFAAATLGFALALAFLLRMEERPLKGAAG